MFGLNDAARMELEELRAQALGVLTPEAVIERARSGNSALHRYFEWDDTAAAASYRMQQARTVIRAVVQIMPNAVGNPVAVRAYVSATGDDGRRAYRAMADVMDDDAMAAKAMRDLERAVLRLQQQYSTVASLRPTLAQMVRLARYPVAADAAA